MKNPTPINAFELATEIFDTLRSELALGPLVRRLDPGHVRLFSEGRKFDVTCKVTRDGVTASHSRGGKVDFDGCGNDPFLISLRMVQALGDLLEAQSEES